MEDFHSIEVAPIFRSAVVDPIAHSAAADRMFRSGAADQRLTISVCMAEAETQKGLGMQAMASQKPRSEIQCDRP